MKQILLLILLALVIASGSYAQSQNKYTVDHSLISGDTAQMIRDINVMAGQTKNDIGTYRKVVRDEDASKYRWHFFKGKELKLVQLRTHDESNEMFVEWYFNNGQLYYSEQNWTNTETKQLMQNNKMYLKDEILFAWISSQKGMVDTTSTDFNELAAALKKYAQELKEGTGK